ncbi:MAG TPA: Mov34/MPN/PAD-1 family protein [Anaeromyxobacteraceae bacterium]|nr:Mov34/MPN/PAD-1 family protein [Anaeromyxobacteraceae bacterium]
MSGEGVRYGPEVLARIVAFCEADPLREVCGFVARLGPCAPLEVVAIPNVADRYHAADPASFPRTSRNSYLMDPRVQFRVVEELERAGGNVVAVWHSHVEVGAYFSAKDQADAVVGDLQLLPGAEYLVFAVSAGRVTEAKRYRYDGAGFVESGVA